MLVYIETTVWSFPFADDSPDLTALTVRFFEACREGRFEPCVSGVVLKEVSNADPARRDAIMALIADIRPRQIPSAPAADELAAQFLALGAVPPSKPDDAAHVAAAFAGGCDALVSWNFKHIANIRRAERFNAIAVLRGFSKRLTIVSPPEVLYGELET